jgi:hypothetical protein
MRARIVSIANTAPKKAGSAVFVSSFNEDGVNDCSVHEKSLRHIRFVRVQVDELSRGQYRRGKQNGEFSFLGHARTPAFCEMNLR